MADIPKRRRCQIDLLSTIYCVPPASISTGTPRARALAAMSAGCVTLFQLLVAVSRLRDWPQLLALIPSERSPPKSPMLASSRSGWSVGSRKVRSWR